MTRLPHPFHIAFRAILLAIGIPLVLFMFGAIRSRQLQSTANPRWAKFAKATGQQDVKTTSESDSSRILVQAASSQIHEQTPDGQTSDQDANANNQTSKLVMPYSGSVTGTATIDASVRSQPFSAEDSQGIASDSSPDEQQLPPIIFRPLDDEKDDAQIALMIAGFKSQLSDVCQRLDRLTTRMHEEHSEQTVLETRLFHALTKLNELASQASETPEVPVAQNADAEFSVEPRRTSAQAAEEPVEKKELAKDSKPVARTGKPKTPTGTNSESSVDTSVALSAELEAQKLQLQTEKSLILLQEEKNRIQLEVEKNRIEHQADKNRIDAEKIQLEAAMVQFHQEKKQFEAAKYAVENTPRLSDVINITRSGNGTLDEAFTVDVQDAEIRQVFARLSEAAKVSIVSSPDVQGRVSLFLHGVRFEAALKAILKSRDYTFDREDNIIVVRTAEEVARLKQQNHHTVVKVYRPNYVTAVELDRLIVPVLSSDGRRSLTSPARTGLSRDDDSDRYNEIPSGETVVVQDTPEVLDQIDRILVEIDVPPLQVNIEAKILSVRLSDGIERGIDLGQLPCYRDSGTSYAEGGLKHASLSCNVPTFIKSVERLADASVVTSQSIQVVNKHRAEILIGDRIGYQSRAGGEVQFMEAGTRLILRPSISADGFIQMEIRPERSCVTLTRRTKLPQQSTAEMTTEVMIRDGATVAIGGLISEQATETTKRMPGMGTIPVISNPFRHRNERQQRTELIVLVTPHIVIDCEAESAGKCLEQITEQRANEFRNGQSSHSRHNLARAHYVRAACYLQQGNYVKARQQVDASLRQNKADLEAIRLRNEINQYLQSQTE